MLFKVLRGLQQIRQEFVSEPSLGVVIFVNLSRVEDLPKRTAMVPPPLPVSHDSEGWVVADTGTLVQVLCMRVWRR